MTTQAKIFTVLEFRSEADKIIHRTHFVTATCSVEAEDVFKEEFGKAVVGLGQPHFYVLTDECMQRHADNGATKRCVFYADNEKAPPMTDGQYSRWIMSMSHECVDEDGDIVPPPYRRIN